VTVQSSPASRRKLRPMTALEAAIVGLLASDILYKMAFRRMRHVQDAEDLASATVETALARDQAGNGWSAPPPPVEGFMGSVMNGVLINQWRKKRPKIVDGEAEEAPSGRPDAEQALVGHEEERAKEREKERVKAELREYFEARSNGHVPLAIIDASEQGLHGGKVLAGHIGCSIKEIYKAHERIQEQITRIRDRSPRGES
jgi:DNA-directed RNA polymerase specialized sigma24 family protein